MKEIIRNKLCTLTFIAIMTIGFFVHNLFDSVVAEAKSPKGSAPSFFEIRDNMNRMTDVQWDDYRDYLKGKSISGCGYVIDVKKQLWGGYKVLIDMDDPKSLSVQDIYMKNIKKVEITRLNKYDRVCFSGRITSLQDIFGSCAITVKEGTVY